MLQCNMNVKILHDLLTKMYIFYIKNNIKKYKLIQSIN